jgi:sigma-B regulation protein RsbQ
MPHSLNVNILEPVRPEGAATLLFAHGYGCDQRMWSGVAAALPQTRRILFDWPGAGQADPAAYSARRHATLDGYAEDLLALMAELDLHDVVFVGHSVAASIGAIAAHRDASRLRMLAMVSPSPCFLNDPPDYQGGFERPQLEGLIRGLSEGHAAWSRAVAPMIMGNPERPALTEQLADSFCAMDPAIALRWARSTFLGDIRAIIPRISTPCFVMQCSEDALAPLSVGHWLHRHLLKSRLHLMEASGHCPHVSAPAEVASALVTALQDWN